MADGKNPKVVNVTLESTDRDKKNVTQSFPIDQANELLNLSNSAWKLKDDGYTWNGKEIAKKTK